MKSTLYERNLLYQQLNFKYVLFKYVTTLLKQVKPLGKRRTALLTLSFLILYLLDIILGAAVLLILTQNPILKQYIRTILSLYTKSSLEWCHEYLEWLMGAPWGIKLNTPLSHFLSTRYIYILDLWKLFYSEFVAVYLTSFVDFLLFLLPFSLTLSIMALHDFLKFLNLCLICFFIISSRVFTLQVSALKSLGRLFMGKKWNVLKQRVDSYDHAGNKNQLLLGTIIFTILLFLLPTTGMYTLVFLYLRVIQYSVQFTLRLLVVSVNKLTVSLLLFLHYSTQDQPVTKVKILVKGLSPEEYVRKEVARPYRVEEGKWCDLEFFSVNNSDITILWNGMVFTVDEMKRVMMDIPREVVEGDVRCYLGDEDCGDRGTVEDMAVRKHSMMHWFGSLPRN